MRFLLIYVMLISAAFADGGSVGSGGTPPVLPTKDERTSIFNNYNSKVQVINLNGKFGTNFNYRNNSRSSLNSSVSVINPIFQKLEVSENTSRDYKEYTIKLDQIEEVTLTDGTVLSKEEILESLFTKD